MQSETKKIGTWSSSVAVVCLALILGFASTGYGDVIVGNFESADSNDGWGQGSNDPNAILTPASTLGVTLGSGSLKLQPGLGEEGVDPPYWRLAWMGSPLPMTDAQFQFDLTMVADEWTGYIWVQVGDMIAINSDGPSGWKQYGPSSDSSKPYSYINRDTGEPAERWWGKWVGDVNRRYTYDISDYDATGATYMQIAISVQTNDATEPTGRFYFDNMRLLTPDMTVNKSKVTAGKTQYIGDEDYNDMKDAFTASGTVALPPDINDVNEVDITITSNADDAVIYTETLSDFNATVVNHTGKYKHSAKITKGQEGKITSLTLDFRKGTFAIAAKNLDLTGLACPFQIKLTVGSYELKGNAYETAVNGKKLIPTRLMRLYDDTLVVSKVKAKHATTPGSDSLSVKGDIAVADMNLDSNEPNLCNEDVVLAWGDGDGNDQTFVIPAGSFKASKKGHTYKCSKVEADANDGNVGVVAATIDLDKATFTVSVKGATGIYADLAGAAVFGISFDTENGTFNEEDDYTLP